MMTILGAIQIKYCAYVTSTTKLLFYIVTITIDVQVLLVYTLSAIHMKYCACYKLFFHIVVIEIHVRIPKMQKHIPHKQYDIESILLQLIVLGFNKMILSNIMTSHE